MNIPGFTDQALLVFYAKVQECLNKDDANPSSEKVYLVRTSNDWRQLSAAIGTELNSRGVPFVQIQW